MAGKEQGPRWEGKDEQDTVSLNKERLPDQQPYKVKLDDLQPIGSGQTTVPVIVPRFQMHIYEGEPGAEKPWHTHYPSMFQVLCGLEGEITYEYIDADDEKQKLTIGPGEVVYLPGGFKHRSEVTSDVTHRHLYVCPYIPEGRTEKLLDGNFSSGYGEIKDNVGLWYDDVSDQVVTMDEEAVEKL